MEKVKNEQNEKEGCWSKVKKLWQCIWNSGGSVSDGPGRAKSAQEIRDEWLKKCPWYDNHL